jgi:hypothetical protein
VIYNSVLIATCNELIISLYIWRGVTATVVQAVRKRTAHDALSTLRVNLRFTTLNHVQCFCVRACRVAALPKRTRSV